MRDSRRLGYADPPYIGQSKKHYKEHPDYAGEVDHKVLLERLYQDFDGFVLHLSSPSVPEIARYVRPETRWCAWVKPFAAFKRNVPVAYAWEPVLIHPVRKPVVGGLVKPLRDWVDCSITLKKGLTGVKPEKVCWWAFECAGALPSDAIDDIFPGSGAVTDAWNTWRRARLTGGPDAQTRL